MNFRYLGKWDKNQVEKLFNITFTASEWKEEGDLIGKLSWELSEGINDIDIFGIGTFDKEHLVAVVFFTKLYFDTDIVVYMLAPVAVDTSYQKKWIGSALIQHWINELKNKSVDVIITYWDHAFYSRVWFKQITEDTIKAPLKLSMPHWWLGLSLKEKNIPIVSNKPSCVKPFDNPIYW